MADMLLSCHNETYSSMVPRRRLDLARKVKEMHSYVAKDFEHQVESTHQEVTGKRALFWVEIQSFFFGTLIQQVDLLGRFEREKVDVMKFVREKNARGEYS